MKPEIKKKKIGQEVYGVPEQGIMNLPHPLPQEVFRACLGVDLSIT
jgi:hypothetical protein